MFLKVFKCVFYPKYESFQDFIFLKVNQECTYHISKYVMERKIVKTILNKHFVLVMNLKQIACNQMYVKCKNHLHVHHYTTWISLGNI